MRMPETLLFFVDDDADDHVIFSDLVSREFPGVSLSFFFSGPELLNYLDTEDAVIPDAIILDYNMPMVNGLECLRELKKMPGLPDIPVVIYSTSGYPGAVEMAKNAGAWRYEVKGDSRDTRELVQRILKLNKK